MVPLVPAGHMEWLNDNAERVDQAIRERGGVMFVGLSNNLYVFPKRIMTPDLEQRVARFAPQIRLLLRQFTV